GYTANAGSTGTTSCSGNGNGTCNPATVNLTLTPSSVALSVTKTFRPSSIVAGSGDHTFTIAVKNTGASSTAHNVVVTDSVDARPVVASESADSGGNCAASSGQSVSCSFATLAAGATATITVHYSVAAGQAATSISNTGSATSTEVTTPATDTKSLTVT